MTKTLNLSLISFFLLSLGAGLFFSNKNNISKTVEVKAETTQYRSHKGRYLKNPLAIQVPHGMNFLEVIQDLYNAHEYNIIKSGDTSALAEEFNRYIALTGSNYTATAKYWEFDLNPARHTGTGDDDCDFIGLTFEGTDDANEAITHMFAVINDADASVGTSFTRNISVLRSYEDRDGTYEETINNVTYYPVKALNKSNNVTYPAAEFNATSGGAYISLYYTTDQRVNNPIRNFNIMYKENFETYHGVDFVRKVTTTTENIGWEDADFDHGVTPTENEMQNGRKHAYMYYQTYSTKVNVHTPEGTTRADFFLKVADLPYTCKEDNNYPGYDCVWYKTSDFQGSSLFAPETGSGARNVTDIYGRYEIKNTATIENQANFFSNYLMKINDSSFEGIGTGKCITDGFYAAAKEGFVSQLNNAGRRNIVDTYNDMTQKNTDTAKAFERFQSWAWANGDVIYVDNQGVATIGPANLISNIAQSNIKIDSLVCFVIVLLSVSVLTFQVCRIKFGSKEE